MTLKTKDPELFALFLKDPRLTGYLVGHLATVHSVSPEAVAETCNQANADHPDLSLVESLVLSMKDTLVAYHEQGYQHGSVYDPFNFPIDTIDDIVKNVSEAEEFPLTIRDSAKALLDGSYLKTH